MYSGSSSELSIMKNLSNPTHAQDVLKITQVYIYIHNSHKNKQWTSTKLLLYQSCTIGSERISQFKSNHFEGNCQSQLYVPPINTQRPLVRCVRSGFQVILTTQG